MQNIAALAESALNKTKPLSCNDFIPDAITT
jgi:hypothetical protein